MRESETFLGILFIFILVLYALTHPDVKEEALQVMEQQHNTDDEHFTDILYKQDSKHLNNERDMDYTISSLIKDMFGGD